MRIKQDEPFEIQPRANGAMAWVLQRATVVALVLGLLGAVLPGTTGRVVAWGAFTVVVGVPLARVAWLAVRWVQRRDLIFAGLAAGLLLVVVTGAVLAASQGS